MKIMKKNNPYTPSMRFTVSFPRDNLYSGAPWKSLVSGLAKTGGRNNSGRITSRHIGGGTKRCYRKVDFFRNVQSSVIVERIEYDPNRSAFIALVTNDQGKKSYVIAYDGICPGDKIEVGDSCEIRPGNRMSIGNIPSGVMVHCLEMKPGKGMQIVRSAGCGAQIMGRNLGKVSVRLPSGRIISVPEACMATVGTISNPLNKNISYGKAGRKMRACNRRPRVRGVAMNPIDHPHGGGEGKSSGGRHPVTPWGVPTKGYKTVKRKS